MAKNDWETDGTHNGRPIECPVNALDCPYYGSGLCHIADPIEECDDFGFFWDSWIDYDETYDENEREDDGTFDVIDETGFDPYMGCYSNDC